MTCKAEAETKYELDRFDADGEDKTYLMPGTRTSGKVKVTKPKLSDVVGRL